MKNSVDKLIMNVCVLLCGFYDILMLELLQ